MNVFLLPNSLPYMYFYICLQWNIRPNGYFRLARLWWSFRTCPLVVVISHLRISCGYFTLARLWCLFISHLPASADYFTLARLWWLFYTCPLLLIILHLPACGDFRLARFWCLFHTCPSQLVISHLPVSCGYFTLARLWWFQAWPLLVVISHLSACGGYFILARFCWQVVRARDPLKTHCCLWYPLLSFLFMGTSWNEKEHCMNDYSCRTCAASSNGIWDCERVSSNN